MTDQTTRRGYRVTVYHPAIDEVHTTLAAAAARANDLGAPHAHYVIEPV